MTDAMKIPSLVFFGNPSPRKYSVRFPNTHESSKLAALRAEIDAEYDALSPTRQLILELLMARWRLGENLWTFDSRLTPQIKYLEEKGWLTMMGGIVENTVRASLTDKGVFGLGIASTKGPDAEPRSYSQYD